MVETCTKCGRNRPDTIADPTCVMGGYCAWSERSTATTYARTMIAGQVVMSTLTARTGTLVRKIARHAPCPYTLWWVEWDSDDEWLYMMREDDLAPLEPSKSQGSAP